MRSVAPLPPPRCFSLLFAGPLGSSSPSAFLAILFPIDRYDSMERHEAVVVAGFDVQAPTSRATTSRGAEKEGPEPVEPRPFRSPSDGQLVSEDDATKGETGDRVSSTAPSADERRLRRGFDDTSNGPFACRGSSPFLPAGWNSQ